MTDEIERLTVLIEANTKSYERAMAKLQSSTEGAVRGSAHAVEGLGEQLASIGEKAAGALKAFGLGAALFEVAKWPAELKELLHGITELGESAEKIGLPVEKLQELQYAAERSGGSVEDLNAGLAKFGINLGKAAAGGGDLAKTFADNGIALKNAAGKQRSFNDLLGDYADLVKNASTDSDRLLLVQQGFGKGADSLVNMLRGGSEELEKFAAKRDAMGGLVTDAEVARIKEIDQAWSDMVDTISYGVRGAVLSVVTATDDLLKHVHNGMNGIADQTGKAIAAAINAGGGAKGQLAADLKLGFFDRTDTETDWLRRAVDKKTVTHTGGNGNGDEAWKAQNEAISNVYDSLRHETDALGMSNRAQEIANELAKAHVSATSADGEAIAEMTGKLYDQRKAIDDINQAAGLAGDTLFNAFDGILLQGKGVNEVLKDMAKSIEEAALRAALLGDGPLGGLFGMSPGKSGGVGGIFGSLLGLFTGPHASGGFIPPGMFGTANEDEIVLGGRAGATVLPAGKSAGGISFSPVTHIDARGASPGVAEQLGPIIEANNRKLLAQVSRMQADPRYRPN